MIPKFFIYYICFKFIIKRIILSCSFLIFTWTEWILYFYKDKIKIFIEVFSKIILKYFMVQKIIFFYVTIYWMRNDTIFLFWNFILFLVFNKQHIISTSYVSFLVLVIILISPSQLKYFLWNGLFLELDNFIWYIYISQNNFLSIVPCIEIKILNTIYTHIANMNISSWLWSKVLLLSSLFNHYSFDFTNKIFFFVYYCWFFLCMSQYYCHYLHLLTLVHNN